MRLWEQQIEVTKRRGIMHLPLNLMREADFILDLVTFKVMKNRYGHRDLTPQQAYEWLNEHLRDPDSRILLLTD
jgi:hypothetical protein